MSLPAPLLAAAMVVAWQVAARAEEAPPAALPGETAAVTAPDAVALVMAVHRAASDCEDTQSEHMRDHPGISADIGPTSVLYAVPCAASGGRVFYRLYARETGEIGGVKTLYFARYSASHGWSGTDLLVDITVDGPVLSAFLPAEDGSGCGHGEWTFTDYAYRLERFVTDATCDARPPEEWRVVYPPG